MSHDPDKPLLRLNQPVPVSRRRSGGGGTPARKFDRAAQVQAHGPLFERLRDVLNSQNANMELRSDANSLAPERLLVFEVTGSVANFARAVSKIGGLEFAGEEELEGDRLDPNPEFYLLVPQLGALKEIVSLWERWQITGTVPRNYTPWRDLFLQLKAVRPWGPSDRITTQNRDYFRAVVDGEPDDKLIRLEIELVFRAGVEASDLAQVDLATKIIGAGGVIIQSSRREEFAYHAVLADVPAGEIRKIIDLDPASLAGADPVANITPQSIGTPIEAADRLVTEVGRSLPGDETPIAAILDAVPVQAHPMLAGRLIIDDPMDLETAAVGQRVHGTAMASLVVHGDLNEPESPISRRVYFRPVMYAPQFGNELFQSDKLIIDTVVEAVQRMRANDGSEVIIVNLSLGDTTKPFSGKMSTWGRALDYLASTYGILFLVSAGNSGDGIPIGTYPTNAEFEAASEIEKATAIFGALDAVKADRRILAPADSINALAIGAWHKDASQEVYLGTRPFSPYGNLDMPNLSSRLGPGLRRGTKPDALFAGGKQGAKLSPTAVPPVLLSHLQPSRYWGLRVAAPPQNGVDGTHFTIGTSAATALATHSAHRIYDAIQESYPQLIEMMPLPQRALLLKSLLVHTASWRGAESFIRSIVDPHGSLNHEHWRREVSRHLGYGFVDPEDAIACANDRATMWATGEVGPEGSLKFDVPLPAILADNANCRSVHATLAWFTPIRPGHLAYRAVKLKIASLKEDALHLAGVGTTTGQPSNSQSESGTVVHRRWFGESIGSAQSNTIPIQIQREKDRGSPIDDLIPFALAISIEMPGALQVYEQARAGIALKPRARVTA